MDNKDAFVMSNGFYHTETGTIEIIKAETYLYTHKKTFGKVFHIKNSDKERALVISFETPALDDKGTPHAVEHVTIEGCKKYPVHGLFSSLTRQSYNTVMGAHVNSFHGVTNYFYATLSENQLLCILKYYLNVVFYPLFYTDITSFLREVWRYELVDTNAPLEITGIIYNEQKGAYTFDIAALYNNMRVLYPGSVVGNVAGGIPEAILTLTNEEIISYHRKYYHPSNATIYLYGDINIEPFLEAINDIFKRFEYQIIFVEKDKICPFNKDVQNVFQYPGEVHAVTADQAILYYSINLGIQPPDLYGIFDILNSVIGFSSSPIMSKLREIMPGYNVKSELLSTTAGECLFLSIMGSHEIDIDFLNKAVDDIFFQIVDDGFDIKFIEAVISNIEFELLSFIDQPDLGVHLLLDIAGKHSIGNSFYYLNAFLKTLDMVKKESKNGFFEQLIEKYIIKNKHKAVSATLVKPGMREALDSIHSRKLRRIKKEMSVGEISEIIGRNARIAKTVNEKVPKWMLKQLNIVTVDTLPVDIESKDMFDESFGGLRVITTEVACGDVSLTNIKYNAAAVTIDELHFLNLYAFLLGNVRTENHELGTLQTKIVRYLKNPNYSTEVCNFYDKESIPVLVLSWKTLNDDYEQAVDLIQEMILRTDINDLAAIVNIAKCLKSRMHTEINVNPINIQLLRALASQDRSFVKAAYMKGLDFYYFLCNLPKMIEETPTKVISALKSVRRKLVYAVDSVVMFAGNAQGIKIFKEKIGKLTDHLRDEVFEPADYSSIPEPSDSEGIIIDSTVQCNVVFGSFKKLGMKYCGKLIPLASLITNDYLVPQIRQIIGAYGVKLIIDYKGMFIFSFRDPAVDKTYHIYEGIANFILNTTFTQENIDGHIINSFSTIAKSEGVLNSAIAAMQDKYLGYPDGYRSNLLREIKSATVEDLQALTPFFRKLMEAGAYSTVGGQSGIRASEKLFKEIFYI